jgi:hypothetical protein
VRIPISIVAHSPFTANSRPAYPACGCLW